MKPITSANQLKQRLLDQARKLNVPYNRLLILFLLEKAAQRMTNDELLAKHLVFKGGYVGVRVFNSPRFTKDIDAVIRASSLLATR